MGSSSFRVYSYEKKEFDTPWHYHPEYELTYIISSSGVRYVGDSFESFEKDDLVLLGPNLPHCWKNIAPQQHQAGAIVFHWGKDLLGEELMQKEEFKLIYQLLQLSNSGIKFELKFAQALKAQLINLLQGSPFERLMGLLRVLNEMALTTHYHLLSSTGFSESMKTTDHQRLNAIYNYVEKNYRRRMTLREVASLVHLSEESFSRFFSKVMGKPFFYFLNEYRVSISCKLLLANQLQIVEIANASGFESLPFFHRQFKKFKGCTPGEFRKAYQGIG